MRGIHLFEGEKPASQLAVRAGDGNLVGLQLQLDAVEDEVVPEVRAAHEEPLVVHDLDRSYNDATDFLHFENNFKTLSGFVRWKFRISFLIAENSSI